jgi:hypothetical protein
MSSLFAHATTMLLVSVASHFGVVHTDACPVGSPTLLVLLAQIVPPICD